jgi:dipeptidyl aminopeptidase/acylaminoacyl peptidase
VKPSDLAHLRLPGAPTLSPDGRTVVVAISRLDLDADETTSQLFEVAVDGSQPPRQLTYGRRDAEPRFSPDGRWLAFTRRAVSPGGASSPGGPVGASSGASNGAESQPQLYVLPVGGGEARRITEHPLGVGVPVWDPSSTRIAYAARVPENGRYVGRPEKEPPRRITRMWYRVDGEGFLLDRPRQVFVVAAVGDGDVTPVQVTNGPFDHGDPDWSPDGAWLTFAAARHDTAGDDERNDIWRCRPDGGDLRSLTSGGPRAGGRALSASGRALSASDAHFTPDGAAVCFLATELDDDGRGAVARSVVVWHAPVDGEQPPQRLLDQGNYHAAHDAGQIVARADGVLFPNERRGAVELLLVPYDGSAPRVVLGGERQVVAAASVGETVVATVTDPGSWGELVVATGEGSERRLTDWSAPYRATVPVAAQRELTTSAPDGYQVHGWVVRPSGQGPHPVLLLIHGGPYTQYGWRLFDEAQVYAAAGYAVVMGNPRGSSGYGQAHGRAIIGDVGEVSAVDLLALLDAALTAPDLDNTRVGVLGGSHGGYMTTWLAAKHGDRFKAAISERAVNAIDSFEGSSDVGFFFADSMYGSDPQRRLAQSPLTYVDQIDIPMLIIHSEQDWRCPLEQAQRLYVALKRRGTPVEMLLFPGEGHGLTRSGLPSHRVARYEAILHWWAKYL